MAGYGTNENCGRSSLMSGAGGHADISRYKSPFRFAGLCYGVGTSALSQPAVSLPDDYSKCILENATAVKGVTTDNALDTLLLACIKLHEEAIGSPWG